MTLDDVKVFLAIAETGNLTAAAQSLYVSQPALSKRLARFESEIGATLFERGQGARKLTLTPAGKLLLPFAEKWETLQQEFSMLHDINSQVHFFIEATDTVGNYVLPNVIEEFNQQEPKVELVVGSHDSRACYANVHDHLCDIAFVTHQHYFQNILTTPLWQEEMLLLRTGDAKDAEVVDPQSLNWEQEVVIPWSSELMHWRQEQLGFAWHPAVTVGTMAQAAPFLLRRQGWTIVPATVAYTAQRYWPELKACRLADPPPVHTVYGLEEYGRHHECADLLLRLMQKQLKTIPGVVWL